MLFKLFLHANSSSEKILKTMTWPCEYSFFCWRYLVRSIGVLPLGDCPAAIGWKRVHSQHSRWSCEASRKAGTFRPSPSPDRRPFLDAAALLLNSLHFVVPLISIALWGYIACNNLATQCINCGGSDHSRWILMRLAKPSRSNEHDRLPLPSVMNKR